MSINTMAISPDNMYFAIGDSEKIISIFYYGEFVSQSKVSLENANKGSGKFQIISNAPMKKLELNYHNDSVNAIAFAKVNKFYLVSGASDKSIIVWKINDDFTGQNIRILKGQSDITELVILPNDQYIFAGCIDNNIYIWKSNFVSNSFDFVNCISLHSNYITSICLDPNFNMMDQNVKFASYVKIRLF